MTHHGIFHSHLCMSMNRSIDHPVEFSSKFINFTNLQNRPTLPLLLVIFVLMGKIFQMLKTYKYCTETIKYIDIIFSKYIKIVEIA